MQNGAQSPGVLGKQRTAVLSVKDALAKPIRPSKGETIIPSYAFDSISLDSEITAIATRIFALTPSKGEISDELSMISKDSTIQKKTTGIGNAESSANCSPFGFSLGDSNASSVIDKNSTSTAISPSNGIKAGSTDLIFPSDWNESPETGGLISHAGPEVNTIFDVLERKAATSPKGPSRETPPCDQNAKPMASDSELFDESTQAVPSKPVLAGVESSNSTLIDISGRKATPTPNGLSCLEDSVLHSGLLMSATGSENEADLDSGSGTRDEQSQAHDTGSDTTSVTEAEWLTMIHENQ
ncbi:hypothetical protein E8E11_011626 [Didymella keratinophila]|nr:hypothetical protein E8E11_011626 [Didymella keratinophila]